VQGLTKTPCQLNNNKPDLKLPNVNLNLDREISKMLFASASLPDRGAPRLWNRNSPAWSTPLVQTLTIANPVLQFPAYDLDGMAAPPSASTSVMHCE
jgi:hypothetical protein